MMNEKNGFNFVVGFGIALLLAALIWYWQTSTDAEEGALDLLDRLAGVEARLQTAQRAVVDVSQTAASVEESVQAGPKRVMKAAVDRATAAPDDLQQVKGIGPVFAKRLKAKEIITFDQLKALDAATLANVIEVNETRAQAILDAVP